MSKTFLPSVVISGTALSDLFFNVEHPKYEEACIAFDPDTTDISDSTFETATYEALKLDALNFIESLGISHDVTPDQLSNNFFERL
jgi:hypothetical protein